MILPVGIKNRYCTLILLLAASTVLEMIITAMIKSKICKMLLLTDDWALVHNKISCKPKSSIGQASILKWMNNFKIPGYMRHHSNTHFLVKTIVTALVYRASKLPRRNKPIREKNPFLQCKAFISIRGILSKTQCKTELLEPS